MPWTLYLIKVAERSTKSTDLEAWSTEHLSSVLDKSINTYIFEKNCNHKSTWKT